MSCHCSCHQSVTKRKADYKAVCALGGRSEWIRLTPEEKAQVEREERERAEWIEKIKGMSLGEQLQHAMQISNANLQPALQAFGNFLRSNQPIEK